MSKKPHSGRRDFLKTAAMGAAGAMGLSALRFDDVFAQSTGGWVAGMQINPAIDNKRVICCHDTKMLTATPANTSWANQNANVDGKAVGDNLDQMAMQLTQKTTAAEAWKTIFRSSKDWAKTRVAMKTNGIGSNTTNRPRVAIYKKLTDVLVDILGVQPANIILFDACDDASGYYNPSTSLTDATKIRAAQASVRAGSMGGFKVVTLTNATAISVASDLADGNIDILVNVAACKSHNGTGGHYNYGSCTLCMKNHFGTFTSGTQAQHSNNLHVGNSATSPPPAPLALFEINKHPAVLGGDPVRQQLCIVDALLSNGASGPGGAWDNRTDRLVMGTLAPIVDYFAAKKILLDSTVMKSSPMPALGVTNAAIILPMFLSNFGYSETDALQWIEYTPDSVPPITPGGTGGTTGSGGTTSSGGTPGTGGTTGAGGTPRTGGSPATGGAPGTGGTRATGGTSDPGTGGTTATGGTTSAGGSMMGGSSTPGDAGGTGGTATTSAPATGGSKATGGTTAGAGGTTSNSVGGGGGSKGTTAGSTQATESSGGGCNVVGADRSVGRWGAMLAFGAVVAGKLRRLVGGGDRSS